MDKNNPDIILREYQPDDIHALENCLTSLQEYLVSLDAWKRLRCESGFGAYYADKTLGKVKRNQGRIYFAQIGQQIVGCVVGTIQTIQDAATLEYVPCRIGVVEELVVLKEYRGTGIGQLLLQKMEFYFASQSCDLVSIEVFTPNESASAFYLRQGYQDRDRIVQKRLNYNH